MTVSYGAIIRAHVRTDMVDQLVAKLRAQTLAPERIIIVDSSAGRSAFDGLIADDIEIVTYPDEDFNFSKAINVGVAVNRCEYSLVISSHIVIEDEALIERGMALAAEREIDAMTWVGVPSKGDPESTITIDRRSFCGNNGLSNAMSMVRTSLYRERPYREEVFSAEDQEWAWWYMKERNGAVLRIATPHRLYHNPYHSGDNFSELKVFNEELSLGYFVRRRYIYPDRIIARFLRAGLAFARGRKDRARMHWRFACLMTKANLVRPKVQSKYF